MSLTRPTISIFPVMSQPNARVLYNIYRTHHDALQRLLKEPEAIPGYNLLAGNPYLLVDLVRHNVVVNASLAHKRDQRLHAIAPHLQSSLKVRAAVL